MKVKTFADVSLDAYQTS